MRLTHSEFAANALARHRDERTSNLIDSCHLGCTPAEAATNGLCTGPQDLSKPPAEQRAHVGMPPTLSAVLHRGRRPLCARFGVTNSLRARSLAERQLGGRM